MSEIIVPIWIIAAIFLTVAVAYAAVGLGGGSSYAALMVVFGFSAASIPNLSLLLNLIVTTVGCYNFVRRGHLRLELLLPFLLPSLPMAWLGGALQVSEPVFRLILAISLGVVLLRIYAASGLQLRLRPGRGQVVAASIAAGGALGLLAGVTGIGGGIFLVPLILVFGLGTIKQAAACGVVFVWLNSLAGLISRSQHNAVDFGDYLPLIIAVLLGGALGSLIGSSGIEPAKLEKVLGILLIVAIFLLLRPLIGT